MKEGNTRPGQSHSMSASDTMRVWKCFVLPGVDDTATRVTPVEGGEKRADGNRQLKCECVCDVKRRTASVRKWMLRTELYR